MTKLIGLTDEHNAEIERLSSANPDVKLPSLFKEIFEPTKNQGHTTDQKTPATSTPERKSKSGDSALESSQDSLDLSHGVEPVSPPG